MFQPLLDAYTDSTRLDETDYKLPLNIALANWWPLDKRESKGFRRFILYFILSQRYKITLHQTLRSRLWQFSWVSQKNLILSKH